MNWIGSFWLKVMIFWWKSCGNCEKKKWKKKKKPL